MKKIFLILFLLISIIAFADAGSFYVLKIEICTIDDETINGYVKTNDYLIESYLNNEINLPFKDFIIEKKKERSHLVEATSNLDTEREALTQKPLSQLFQRRTTIVTAHRLSTINKAEQILVIEAGSIAKRDTHKTRIAQKGRYNDLYTYEAKI